MPKNDYVISLKKAYDNKPSKRRANYAVRIVYDFLKKHTRKERDQIIIAEEVNNFIWSKSIRRPPRKVNVSLKFKDNMVYVFLKDSVNASKFGKEDVSKEKKKKGKSVAAKKETKEKVKDVKKEEPVKEEKKDETIKDEQKEEKDDKK